ncbi:SOSS complex subunit B family protein [Halobacteriaceae archaeon GCM10025711]
MSTTPTFSNEVSVGEQADEHGVDEFEVVDEALELEATVELEIQGRIDSNHPDAGVSGLTLAGEERLAARELEIRRTRERVDSRQDSDREERTRRRAAVGSRERRDEFDQRAGSVDAWLGPDRIDAREQLPQEELGRVNQEAMRLAGELDGWSRAAISRRLAQEVVDGRDVRSAVLAVFEELKRAPGQVIPIGVIPEVERREVSIEGRVETLWNPSHPSIAQVGLIADDSGQTRVTIWKASNAPWIKEGEKVRIHGAARNWYEGRVSLAVTGWSTLHFPERGRWWE